MNKKKRWSCQLLASLAILVLGIQFTCCSEDPETNPNNGDGDGDGDTDGDADGDADTDTDTDSDGDSDGDSDPGDTAETGYPGGDFVFYDGNTVAENFKEPFQVKDFEGRYAVWVELCPH